MTAQQPQNTKEETVTKFFKLINDNQAEEAINQIFSDYLIQWISSDELLHLKQELIGLDSYVGAFKEYEYLATKLVSSRYAIDYYFGYYERQPILFVFKFYKPEDSWRVQNLSFTTDFDDFVQATDLTRTK